MRRLLKPKLMYRYARISAHRARRKMFDFPGDNFPAIPHIGKGEAHHGEA